MRVFDFHHESSNAESTEYNLIRVLEIDAGEVESSSAMIDKAAFGRENNNMNTTIELPPDLVAALERRAADRGQNLKQTVTELLQQGLHEGPTNGDLPRSRIMVDPKTRLPYIECRHPATEVTSRLVADILLEQEATWHGEAR